MAESSENVVPCLMTGAITRAVVRHALASLSTEALALHMQPLGWNFESRLREKGWYCARFETWDWLGVPCGAPVSFGFSTQEPDLDAMIWCARRAAELCLQVAERFTDNLPANPDIYGRVRPQPACIEASWRQARDKFADPDYQTWRDEQRAARVLRNEFLFEQHGHFHLIVDGRETLMSESLLKKLERQIQRVWAKRRGEIAL